MQTHPQDQILSVSQFTNQIKSLLENSIPETWVRGEVSNLRIQGSSGHYYFTLKDPNAQLSAVLFRGNASRLTTLPKEGQQLLVFGQLSVYPPRGNYQLIVRLVLPDGVGRLQQQFNELKEKLASEGLFDSDNKFPIPSLPRHIAVITSPSGAAIKDFISILKRRNFKGKLSILPSLVQGKDAHLNIIKQLKAAHFLKNIDLIVLTRGGGSLEDLWPFNEESLVRSIAASKIPTISAVGHEIDFTLSDFAADLRAETPSAAAEIISSHFLDLSQRLLHASKKIHQYSSLSLQHHKHSISTLQHRLKPLSPQSLINTLNLKLDDLSSRLSHSLVPQINLHKQHLQQLQIRLNSNSIQATLNRGYAILKDNKHNIIKSTSQLPSAPHPLHVHLHDGEVTL